MVKKSILFAIITLIATPSLAEDDGIVRIRSDGKMIDAMGKIIAVPNIADKRNDDYKRYYQSLDAKGKPVAKSDYYIINDPLKGMVKVSVNDSYNGLKGNGQPAEKQQQNGMVTKYSGSQTLIKDPDAPIYNNVNNSINTVY